MSTTRAGQLSNSLSELNRADNAYATKFVERLLAAAREAGVSDVHLQPHADELEIRWRLDGVLQPVGVFPLGSAADVVTKLKVLADLLTYRTDVPQEGRIRAVAGEVEMRVSTFPTLHGERAVVRLFTAEKQFALLGDLGLPADMVSLLERQLTATSGAVLITGPAGSGKTTTAYACIRQLVRDAGGGKNIVSLEDPIEVVVAGVAQSQIKPAAGFDLTTGLRSILRQDPEVILVGEIRDRETAEIVIQASLTGHLVITTFHAGSAVEALSRLLDMAVEPYLLRSGILSVLNQRLLRRLCDCARNSATVEEQLGLPVERARVAVGCEKCLATGYRGRIAIGEMLTLDNPELASAVLARADSSELQRQAVAAGMTTRWQRACAAVAAGLTSPAEVRRVLGW